MLTLKDPTLLTDRCLIGGEWTGTPVDDVLNPATGERVGGVPRFGAGEALAAVRAAGAAFPKWSKLLAKERATRLRRWNDLILANRDDLALILTSEQGKPLSEARGEIDYAASFVEFYAEEARRIYGETIPSHRADSRTLVIKQPVGVVAAITPWNFPAAMITRKVAPALAAGCTVVVKPAPETPLTALALGVLAERAGIDGGILNIITGDAPAIGKVLTENPLVRAISFTGSTEVGKILMRQAASTVKKVGLELGGNAPFIVFDDADLDAAVEGTLVSKFRNMGQTCVCANRIYAQDSIYDAFVAKLAAKVATLKVGNGIDDGVTQGPLITTEAIDKVERHVADATAKGAKVVIGGKRHALGGTFFEPTVLSGITTDMIVTEEETFGPVAPVYRFKDEADVIAQANASPYGLAAYFYARDLGRVFRVAEALESGMVGVNSALLGADVVPFGGVKESGLGREGSRHGIEEYVDIKYILLGGLDT
ncbi:NAD-dependent succinate-semialdehyde dehydrogenase [Bradyrhizobium sp. U87765 SZCCT0131]|uniref:NAD-dependent succinate-semialdehyde dehydrogenase n=1 Tax=unclassified Bradyrhizobium TaxID=2631580 RepID=UPI001BABD2E0|nr:MULTISPECIES: NAD-dependent succinate-semialdehyde dehydrogenase [unclassified Bradyrhizobium]MBR1219039.1 NAD-dependent succinate-semialdehyde dehydrogenase [Bradyrhizobium sp. U87765 SZCCT0131]MBR1261690.1 NAD-dependent succinate-semialdehyde dehydrogenase [Bradyrhizobium sp. U87765 SZCCT0134]MBR1306457.1 NAD-dependent succinate-semialdehyde dehydrogenase [Bradyrhizobium sp. U87765 SZCCT0110]MBR1317472.1 NAD-dependent succinate-semialdehyde dehydrogenase [Bradyrhizobium sp. U87765 SZCCT010